MPLSLVDQTKSDLSGAASQNARQLAYAGIAVIWMFRVGGDQAGGVAWDASLLFALVMFGVALLFDLLQYLWGTASWTMFFMHCEERDKGLDDLVSLPRFINTFSTVFFFAKIASVIVGHVALLQHLVRAFNHAA